MQQLSSVSSVGSPVASPSICQVEKQKRSARKVVQLPISMKGESGVTRDISVSGMFIVQDRQQEIGSRIEFTIDLDTPMGKIQLCCEGEVTRTEKIFGSDGRVGIGIRILKQFGRQLVLEDLPDDSAIA